MDLLQFKYDINEVLESEAHDRIDSELEPF